MGISRKVRVLGVLGGSIMIMAGVSDPAISENNSQSNAGYVIKSLNTPYPEFVTSGDVLLCPTRLLNH